ncbi:alkaline phosphatase-like protein, partial [Linderina pennispora]
MIVSDGFGVASETLARTYVQQIDRKPYQWLSNLDEILVGTSRTKASDSLVTDSAAGATAFSCGKKSYNGAIGVTDDEKPCGTVLEAAKLQGYKTGLVTTSRITHATPASFAAHVVDRDMEGLIAQHEIGDNVLGNKVDLLLGGGLCFFQPNTTKGSCRTDTLDAWKLAQTKGYSTFSDRASFDALKTSAKLPLLGLFTSGHMSYEIDRDAAKEPSLAEMATKALNILHKNTENSKKGFFIMIEAARIDMAGHDNDPAAHLRDILQYWETITAVRKFIDAHPDTSMVATSDHETGGLTLAVDPDYVFYPKFLQPVKKSTEVICPEIKKIPADKRSEFVRTTVIPQYLGLANVTDSDVKSIVDGVASGSTDCKHSVGHVVSKYAHIGWTTGGHTGVDVGLYAYGKGTEKLHGNNENTQVGEFLRDFLRLELDSVTKRLANETTVQPGFSWSRAPTTLLTRRDASGNSYHEQVDSYHPARAHFH